MTIIKLALWRIDPDYREFKPLRPVLVPHETLVVELSVDFDDGEYFKEDNEVTVTSDGFAKIMQAIQDTIGESTYKLNLEWDSVSNRLRQEWAE